MEGPTLRVLVADDQDIVRESVCDALAAIECEVCGAVESGEAAVEQVAQLRPDVVLMDISMPGIGGIEAARLIRELPQPAPVVFLTALADRDVARRAAESGGFGYLVKPVHARQIGPMLQTAVQRFQEMSKSKPAASPEADARPVLDQLITRLRSAGLDAAAGEFVAAVAAQCNARGAAISLLSIGAAAPVVPASWGEVPPPGSVPWRALQAAAAAVGEGPAGVWHAPILDASGAPAGMLVLFGVASPDAGPLLKVLAAGLGDALSTMRTQQPIAWRRWAQAAPSG